MPFRYVCTNPACKQVFETVVANNRCPGCQLGRLQPALVGEGPVDTFPARGAPQPAAVSRHDNMNAAGTLHYRVTDATDRSLKIEVDNGGKASTFEIGASRVVQVIGGELSEWVILSPSCQPDWGHFGATAMQTAIRNLGREPPPSKPIYLRLGFQHRTNVHTGFGLIHILFSHSRQSFKLVSDDIMQLIKGAEMRESFYSCSTHKAKQLDAAQAKEQQYLCAMKVGNKACGSQLKAKHQTRIFKSNGGAGNRYVLSIETVSDGSVLMAIFENRDDTFNLVTMYRTTRAQLLRKKESGEFELLYPRSFA